MKWLFDYYSFNKRNTCGPGWTNALALSSQISDFIIFLSYITIPFSLMIIWYYRKKDLPSPYVILLFGHFIFFCGLTHLNDVIAFHYPAYRYFIFIKSLTAIFSLITAIVLPFTITYLLSLPSFTLMRENIDQLQAEIFKRNIIETECKHHRDQLMLKVNTLESQLNSAQWLGGKYQALEELKQMLEKEIHL